MLQFTKQDTIYCSILQYYRQNDILSFIKLVGKPSVYTHCYYMLNIRLLKLKKNGYSAVGILKHYHNLDIFLHTSYSIFD